MTADDPALSPAEEAAVRARLAEARHTDPVPDHVVARLDGVLADLTAERTAEPAADRREQDDAPVAPVVPLASRRRRALSTGLVAAAAVVALGVALPQVLDSTGGSDSASSGSAADSGGSVAESGPGQGDDSDDAAAGSAPSELAESPGASSERTGSAFVAPLALRSDEALRPAVRPLARPGAVTAYDASPGCVLDVGAGERVDATWDGLPAVVVLRPVEEGRQDVEVFVCGSDEVVASTTLRAP
ncbi:hypothetical protein [Nocardioides terrigena]|uniref:hypothetical protein n=1 Tax=Nocardioides terrigena TaxID=424797 RepID=UPI000D309F8F|nr:hypothetical protein [Nocardioides terrigena]